MVSSRMLLVAESIVRDADTDRVSAINLIEQLLVESAMVLEFGGAENNRGGGFHRFTTVTRIGALACDRKKLTSDKAGAHVETTVDAATSA